MPDETPTESEATTDEADKPSEDQDAKAPKTYTKAELDGLVNKAKVAARREFGDYNDLKTKAEEFDKLAEATKTNEERLRERGDRAVRERDSALTRANASIVRGAIISAASRLGAVDPEAVAALLPRDDVILEGEEVIGVEEAVQALLAKKPYLRGAGAARGGSELQGPGQEPAIITRSQIQKWAREGGLTPERTKQIEEANKAGRIAANR